MCKGPEVEREQKCWDQQEARLEAAATLGSTGLPSTVEYSERENFCGLGT